MTLLSEFDQIAVPVADQYLIYRIEAEYHAIKVVNVSEIRSWEPVARVPNTPACIKGVLNLRGSTVPVIDMRIRLGVPAPHYGKQTVVIVARSEIDGRERLAALVVDSVWEVMIAAADDVRATPDFGNDVETEFIVGLADHEGQLVALLDIDAFMRHPDIYQAPQPAVCEDADDSSSGL